jgi:hypothetical protein
MANVVNIYRHVFQGYKVKSSKGWQKFIAGKESYILRGATARDDKNGDFFPVIICDQRCAEGSQEDTDMKAHIQDYIDNHDNLEDERDTKLKDACDWKIEQLTLSGVDLTDSIERKVWQQRLDLMTDGEKDALIDDWEANA